MSDADLNETLDAVEAGYEDFSDDERAIIESWVAKLRTVDEDESPQDNTLKYALALAKQVTAKQLSFPFDNMPPDPLPEFISQSARQSGQGKKFSFQMKRMPCNRPRAQDVLPPKKIIEKKVIPLKEPPDLNEFEDVEEIAHAIATSKGQTFAEFIASVSRHTKDFGQELRLAMKAETCGFRDYVDHVLSQRIKDLTEVMDEEQNRELLRIKKDTEKWQIELTHLKKRIKEIVPAFDIDLYRKDKNFLRKQFSPNEPPGLPQDDSLKQWQEENCHRLRWITEMTNKISRCNEQITKEISELKSEALELEATEATKQQNRVQLINCEIGEYQRLKQERDQLLKENAEILSQLQNLGH